MFARHLLFVLAAILFSTGCQTKLDIAQPNASWTTHESSNRALRFELPNGLIKTDRSKDGTTGLTFENATGDFSINVVHASDGLVDQDYPGYMIDIALEDRKPLGATRRIRIGASTALQQDMRSIVNYRVQHTRTIASVSKNDRLVFEVTYSKRHEAKLKPVFDRVVSSLRFKGRTSTKTRHVSSEAN